MAIKHKFKMVQFDTLPEVWLSLTDDITQEPIDVSDVGTAVYAYIREVGSKAIKDTIVCDKLVGVVIAVDEETGAQTISNVAPYDVAGRGGRVSIVWNEDTLDKVGTFQAEISVVFSNDQTMTWYDLLQFTVREQFA